MGLVGDIGNFITGAAGLGYEITKDQHLTGAQREANAFSAEQAEIARQWQEDQYLKYNSPAAMMHQYKEAGLNPMLVAGYKGPGASMASAAPSSVPPTGSQGVGSGMLSLASLMANIDALKSQSVKSKAEADKAAADADLSRMKSYREQIASGFDAQMFQADLDNKIVQKQNTLAGIAKVEQEIDNLKEQKNVIKNEAVLREVESALTAARTVLTYSESRSMDARAFVDEWTAQFIKDTGYNPDSNLRSQISQLIGSETSKLVRWLHSGRIENGRVKFDKFGN